MKNNKKESNKKIYNKMNKIIKNRNKLLKKRKKN